METAITQTCSTCGESFLLPAAERQFRRERGLQDPVECPECRAQMRSVRNTELIALYERGDTLLPGDAVAAAARQGSSGRDRSHGRPHGPTQRYNTVCAACGAETQVPFVPRGDRPVYCRECFNARKGR